MLAGIVIGFVAGLLVSAIWFQLVIEQREQHPRKELSPVSADGADAIKANVPENGTTTELLWRNVQVRPHFRSQAAVQQACEQLVKDGELAWSDSDRLWFPT